MVRPEELFADDSEIIHAVRFLTRGDVNFFANATKMINARGKQFGQVSSAFVWQ